MTADEVIQELGLSPLPGEGGFYAETYRSSESVPPAVLKPGYRAERNLSTAILYLLTPDTCSAMHRLIGDEIYHFYLGDPVDLLLLGPDGSGQLVTLGHAFDKGMRVQQVVPGGVWQGSRLRDGGRFALLGTTMAPGFSFDDWTLGGGAELAAQYPEYEAEIRLRS